jgi:hypothetical protein
VPAVPPSIDDEHAVLLNVHHASTVEIDRLRAECHLAVTRLFRGLLRLLR